MYESFKPVGEYKGRKVWRTRMCYTRSSRESNEKWAYARAQQNAKLSLLLPWRVFLNSRAKARNLARAIFFFSSLSPKTKHLSQEERNYEKIRRRRVGRKQRVKNSLRRVKIPESKRQKGSQTERERARNADAQFRSGWGKAKRCVSLLLYRRSHSRNEAREREREKCEVLQCSAHRSAFP